MVRDGAVARWWWAGVLGIVVLLVPAVMAAAVGPSRVLALPGIVIGVLGVVGSVADLWQPRSSPPEPVRRAMKEATTRQRMAAMRAARHDRAHPGPLAQTSAWHRGRLAELRRHRPWTGYGPLMTITAIPAINLTTHRAGTSDWWAFAVFGACVLLLAIAALVTARPPRGPDSLGRIGSARAG